MFPPERVPMSRTEPAATPLGDAFHVFDTTLRDGAQREGISYSVADKLAVARHLDALGVGLHRGWLARRPAQGHRVLRPGRGGGARAAARRAGRVRRHPQGGHVRPPRTRRCWRCSPAGRRSSRSSRSPTGGTSSGRCAPTWPRTARWSPTRSRSSAARAAGCSSTPSTSSTASPSTPTPRCACSTRRSRRAPTSPCSATPTAACCRWASPRSSRRWPRAPVSGSASTARTTRAARSPTRWPRYKRARRTSSAPRTAMANGRATPTCSPSWGIS